jgi:hypothetical protein
MPIVSAGYAEQHTAQHRQQISSAMKQETVTAKPSRYWPGETKEQRRRESHSRGFGRKTFTALQTNTKQTFEFSLSGL